MITCYGHVYNEEYFLVLLATCLLLVNCLIYILNPKMEAVYSIKTLLTYKTTRRHTPEENIIHSQHSDNLKSDILWRIDPLLSSDSVNSDHFWATAP
jgi:hypothetical protein